MQGGHVALEKKHFSHLLNYFPGLIILVFGMLALYSSVLLIDVRHEVNRQYNDQIKDMLAFQNEFFRFELSYDSYMKRSSPQNFETLKKDFHSLNEHFADMQKNLYSGRDDNHKAYLNYEHFLYLIRRGMTDMWRDLTEYENEFKGTPQASEYKRDLHEQVEHLFDSVHGLQEMIFSNFEHTAFSEEILGKETLLYWSVLVMGFSGFVLIVLNSDKLRQLKVMNEEKMNSLALLEQRLAALEMAQDGILIINRDDELLYMNKAQCKIIGIAEDQRHTKIGGHWRDLFSEREWREIQENIFPEVKKYGHWMGDFPIHQQDETVIYTELSLTRLPDGGLIGTFQDVSDRRESEKEKKMLEEQFFQAQKMEAIGRLAGGIAHDFNNILAAMNGYAEFLSDDLDEDSEQHKFAENILQAGRQARDLVDQMLTFSRRSDTEYDTLDVAHAVHEAISMLRATLPKTIELKDKFSVPYAPISGNATQISQVIMNLCVNASDAIEDSHGKIEIALDVIEAEDPPVPSDMLHYEMPGTDEPPVMRLDDISSDTTRLMMGHVIEGEKYVKLCLHDSGCGMSRAIMEHIFEPFFTTKAVDKGTGLGLSTVHGVVAAHQGAMIINSTLGKGTRFELFFPLQGDTLVKPPELQNEAALKEIAPHRKHILLVEDQETVRDMTLSMLMRMGYETSYAVSGLDGLDRIRENPDAYDLVITDHNMPKMTGIEMVQQVHIDLPHLDFIVLSGYSEKKMQDLIEGHPAIKMVIRKPVSADILAKKIKMVLAMQESRKKA